MYTLSDDLTVKLPTTGLSEGYGMTTIERNNTPVFIGHTYIDGNDSSVYVNLNDIAIQNRGKYDYLKLNDAGILVSNTLHTVSNVSTRFDDGQISEYWVYLEKDTSVYSGHISAITAYIYPNEDIRPTFDLATTILGRMMQGCDWEYYPEEEIGSFTNIALPHYPAKYTTKYGFGLQLFADEEQNPYELRSEIGNACPLGYTTNRANQTFISLQDMVTTFPNQPNKVQLLPDRDTVIYLKRADSNNDEFGHYIGHTEYKRREFIIGFFVQGELQGEIVTIETAQINSQNFNNLYLPKYMELNPNCYEWDYDAIVDGDGELYDSDWQSSKSAADSLGDDYKSYFEIETTLAWTEEQLEIGYTGIMITPIFSDVDSTNTIVEKYEGNCPVAVMDYCYSRYYLAWVDRYGDIMSQEFDGKIEYTEDVEKEEIQDYKRRRRVSHKTLQPKWKISTKWLDEKIYPIYESIYNSPYLLLYDSQTDRGWNVILTDSEYKEKTYKTEKKLFNLELNVEANSRQNYVY